MRKVLIALIIALIILPGIIWIAVSYREELAKYISNKGNGNNNGNNNGNGNNGQNSSSTGEFVKEIFAENLKGARDMVFDASGNIIVSRTSENAISLVEIKDGTFVKEKSLLTGLDKPHGLAFDPDNPDILFFATQNGVFKINLANIANETPQKLVEFPAGGRHFTRSIIFGSDKKLYISIGSSCDVCNETDSMRAKIFVMDKDGSNFKEFAKGLRNSVFMALHPKTGLIFATDMGRDFLGDDLPPDEINIIKQGNYGWPICYGKNIHDTVFDQNTYIRNPCMEPFETPSFIDIPAHSAPLGLSFIDKDGWPEGYKNDLLVAYHGSWNRTVPTGYKIVRYFFDENGNYENKSEDFLTGFINENNVVSGRPVDILIKENGIAYISDDFSGVIHKIFVKPALD